MVGERLFFIFLTCCSCRFGSCWSVVHLCCVLTEKKGLQSLPSGGVPYVLYLAATVAGLLEVDLQVVLQVLLILHVLYVIQEDGSLWTATEGLK